MKKFLLTLISLLCVFSITACSVKEAASSVDFNTFFTFSPKGSYDNLSSTADKTVYKLGDVNMDGKVSNLDILELYKYIFNSTLYPISKEILADTSQDGIISNLDILLIYKYIYNSALHPLPDVSLEDILNNNSHGEAYYIFEVFAFYANVNGWNVDNRFDLYNTTGKKNYILNDKSNDEFYSLSRDFDCESDGILRLELIANLASINGGMSLSFKDPNGNKVVSITEENGYISLVGKTKLISNITIPSNTDYASRYSIIFEIGYNMYLAL